MWKLPPIRIYKLPPSTSNNPYVLHFDTTVPNYGSSTLVKRIDAASRFARAFASRSYTMDENTPCGLPYQDADVISLSARGGPRSGLPLVGGVVQAFPTSAALMASGCGGASAQVAGFQSAAAAHKSAAPLPRPKPLQQRILSLVNNTTDGSSGCGNQDCNASLAPAPATAPAEGSCTGCTGCCARGTAVQRTAGAAAANQPLADPAPVALEFGPCTCKASTMAQIIMHRLVHAMCLRCKADSDAKQIALLRSRPGSAPSHSSSPCSHHTHTHHWAAGRSPLLARWPPPLCYRRQARNAVHVHFKTVKTTKRLGASRLQVANAAHVI